MPGSSPTPSRTLSILLNPVPKPPSNTFSKESSPNPSPAHFGAHSCLTQSSTLSRTMPSASFGFTLECSRAPLSFGLHFQYVWNSNPLLTSPLHSRAPLQDHFGSQAPKPCLRSHLGVEFSVMAPVQHCWRKQRPELGGEEGERIV